LQDLAFQQVTKEQSFKQRHHLRMWKTGMELPNGKRVWVGACSFDTHIKVQFRPPFIHHAIDPNLDQERDFLARSLQSHGAARVMSVSMTPPVYASLPITNSYGAKYFTDGRAVVIEV
jgi:undecaprenyl-diphosphatase